MRTAAQIQEQRLATVFEILAGGGGLRIECQHFLAVFFHAEHKAEVQGMVILGQGSKVGLHAQQDLL